MGLQTYKAKRNFRKTSEPSGSASCVAATGHQFVVQKHDASNLHYDFRLELDGVLLSWAVPRGPSLDPAKKSLAVHVEDHPVEYSTFEGTIPKGEYGGGIVAVWDRGTWQPIGDPRSALRAGKLSFTLVGERLHGEWALVRLRGRGDDGKNWLLMKKRDAFASTAVIKGADSIVTGRTLKEIAEGKKVTAKPRATKDKRSRRSKKNRSNASATIARASTLPSFSPQLAVLADAPPSGREWTHEIKYDGYRLLAKIADGRVTLLTRNGNDWTHRFKTLADSLSALKVNDAIVDGEAVVLDAEGRSDFQALQMMLKSKEKARPVFFAFDLPFVDGKDLRDRPLNQRFKQLSTLLRKSKLPDNIRLSERIDVAGDEVLKEACRLGLEGIISKRVDSPYVSKRDPSWLKSKCRLRQEFVIVGYSQPQRSRVGIGALLLGYHDENKQLVYAGRVGTGFDTALLTELRTTLDKLSVMKSPLDVEAPARERGAATWVKPTRVAEVTFTGWTRDGMLRHPVFVALRSDKPATSIVRERAVSAARVSKSSAASRQPEKNVSTTSRSQKAASESDVVNGVTLSHPDKVLFDDVKLTKRDVAEYMQLVSKWMLPHVARRPLALVRCPAGRGQKCFFQRNWSDTLPDSLAPVDVGENGKTDEHISLDDERGLVSLVQIGVLEIHTWNCRVKNIEAPDQLIFDLDPADDVAWKNVIVGARLVRKQLEQFGLPTFLKTSGGKGLHIVVPLKPTIDWERAKSFSGDLARNLSNGSDLFIANMRKDLRKGKIYIDFHRNGRGATAVAPYSTRARAGAPVSMPISWEELGKITSASHFTVETARRYLNRRKSDPWKSFERSRVDLARLLRRASAA